MTVPSTDSINHQPGRLWPATGLLLAGAVGLWWLGSSRLALQRGADAGPAAASALAAAWLLRAMALALLAPLAGWAFGLRAALAASLALLAPSWPVVVLAWSAAHATALATAGAEGALVLAAAALCAGGAGAARAGPARTALPMLLPALGLLVVAALWAGRGALTAWALGGP